MSSIGGKARLIDLGDDFGEVIINVNRAHITVHADGGVEQKTVAGPPTTTPEVGDEMPDGTIYAGISPDTHEPLYARPRDESGTYRFNEAAAYAKTTGNGFRAPSKGELNVLWENRNKGKLKGTFNETGTYTAGGWYWSSTPDGRNAAWAQRFSTDGIQHELHRLDTFSLRLVR